MTWFITHKPAYDADFVELPKNLQKQASQAHAELEQDPATSRGDTIKPLKGWDNLWRYRLGDHRLILPSQWRPHPLTGRREGYQAGQRGRQVVRA